MITLSPQSISELVAGVKEDVIKWRRYLHEHPELSFQEENTSQYVYDVLQSFGGLELSRPTKTSVVARLIGPNPGKVLAIRADMDALPITEDTDFAFKSANPGVMHACGHDGHTAMLLGTAKILTGLREQIRGEVRFLFQHAEELFPGGASQMVAAGVMEGVHQVIGIHLKSMLEVGKVSVLAGPINAAPDTFHVTIIGSGGHAAYPHTTVDSVLIAAETITNLQHVVSRNTDPLDRLVLSVTQIVGGTADNVIPGSVEFGGTVRSYNAELRDKVPGLMERIIKGVTAAHGATYQFEYTRGYDPVVNDATVTQIVEATLKEVFGEERVVNGPPTMGGEDFSAFQKAAPGTFFQVGAGYGPKESWYPHHHPKFAIDEDALPVGVESFVNLAFRLLEE
ncbi:amidohydrolase [Alicyclobacillus mengziensis]|uniref:Amidohydrolase n=1 Tax=Alicyclobacillus mengziensis TaxID=2931921 RepID=A0A9X7Z7C3_9BACL|nr:amidohydrolase [Alicyclobacillus mengziensis]QSO47073.1 amidohydrolase [Alicyclobacillus mengziensis]